MFKKIPLKLQKVILKWANKSKSKSSTFLLTSLGLINLPKEIEDHIDMLEFMCNPDAGYAYTFSSISINNTLSLTVSAVTPNKEAVEKIFKSLEQK
jgi:hypothetical protein